MAITLLEFNRTGRVVMILPSEGKLRQRQIQSFAWAEQDLQARLNRLRQSELARTDRMQERALSVIPFVEWAFYKPIQTAKELAEKLAVVSRKIEQAIPTVYEAERQDGYLHTLLTSFQRELLPTLKLQPDNNKDYSRYPNLSQAFLNAVFNNLSFTPTPEAVFYYIYAILHSPRYRTRYVEFLKNDFPRIPLTSSNELFRKLTTFGEEIVSFHLLKSPKLNNLITKFKGSTRQIDSGYPKYSDGELVINRKGDRFTGVPKKVWNFYIGGCQVCQKWLKDRKGRTLTQEGIIHYQRVVVALQETIRLMQQIDEAIPRFPIE